MMYETKPHESPFGMSVYRIAPEVRVIVIASATKGTPTNASARNTHAPARRSKPLRETRG